MSAKDGKPKALKKSGGQLARTETIYKTLAEKEARHLRLVYEFKVTSSLAKNAVVVNNPQDNLFHKEQVICEDTEELKRRVQSGLTEKKKCQVYVDKEYLDVAAQNSRPSSEKFPMPLTCSMEIGWFAVKYTLNLIYRSIRATVLKGGWKPLFDRGVNFL